MGERLFPVLLIYTKKKKRPLDCPTHIPWARIEPYAQQANKNHGQSLETLASRGGLDPCEIRCAVEGRGLDHHDLERDVEWLKAWLGGQP